MPNELNLFESDMETVAITDIPQPKPETPPAAQIDRDAEKQLLLHIKRAIEALLFASKESLSLEKIREVTDLIQPLKPRAIRELLETLKEEYIAQQRGFRLEEIAQGFILRTCEELSPYIEQLYRNKRSEKLSSAATEVLAIVAYKQPITRPDIDAIRGVDSSGVVAQLIERQLIESVGKLEAPGRPTLYGITKEFLLHFGLKDLKELPKPQ